MNIDDNWQPTAPAVNSLPAPVRRYIHGVETLCDPAYLIQQIAALRDENDQLRAFIAERDKP